MEYRSQTYLGTLQMMAVIFGSLFLSAVVDHVDDMLDPLSNSEPDPLKYIRVFAHFGWVLAAVSITWVWLSIRAERIGSRWATKRLVILSGILLLAGITTSYFWAAIAASNVLAPLGGW